MNSKSNHRVALIVGGLIGLLTVVGVQAQTEESPLKVPASGDVNLHSIPRMGEDIFGSLLSSHIEKNPLQAYLGNTLTCLVQGLWECHTWFDADGTGVQFHTRKKPDGSMELGSSAFTYRLSGKPGDYHLCLKPFGSKQETCRKEKWEEGHYLYDEWFNNYDRPAESGFPEYKNVHQQHAIVAGHQ